MNFLNKKSRNFWATCISAITLLLPSAVSLAQQRPIDPGKEELRTFYLSNVLSDHDEQEIVIALRSVLDPHIKIYLAGSQNAIVAAGTPDELAMVQRVVSDLDKPKKAYKLTFTMVDLDAGKRVGVQHYSVMVVAGQRTTLKQGSKVPVITGTYNPATANANQQVQYLDIGMNFTVTLSASGSGLQLNSKVEQSSVAEEKSSVGAQDPVVRQSVIEGTTNLTLGKTTTIGSIDITGSTRRLEIEVTPELVQ